MEVPRVHFSFGRHIDPHRAGHTVLTNIMPPAPLSPIVTKALQLVAERALPKVADVYALARTNKSFWEILETELYRTDILRTKELERGSCMQFREVFQGVKPGDKLTFRQRKLMKEMHIPEFHQTFPSPTDKFLKIHIANIRKAEDRLLIFHTRPSLQMGVAPILLQAICDKQLTPERREYMVQKCLQVCAKTWPGYVDVKRHGATALLLATLSMDYETAKQLVGAGCFVDCWSREPKGMRKMRGDGSMEIIRSLEVKPPLFYDKKSPREYMYRPLSVAITTRQADLALLLARNTRDGGWARSYGRGLRPMADLLLASFAGMAPVVRALLQLGYPVEGSFLEQSRTILPEADAMCAAAGGVDNNTRVFEVLIEYGAHIRMVGRDFNHPLRIDRPLRWALVHEAPTNAIFFISRLFISRLLSPPYSTDEFWVRAVDETIDRIIKICRKSDALQPVLSYIMDNLSELVTRERLPPWRGDVTMQEQPGGGADRRATTQVEPGNSADHPMVLDG